MMPLWRLWQVRLVVYAGLVGMAPVLVNAMEWVR